MKREFLQDVVEYVELTDGLIANLRKQAEQKAPAFSDDALRKTAAALVEADVLSADASDILIDSFRQSPDKALDAMQKLAEERTQKQTPAQAMIGKPAIEKTAGRVVDNKEMRESDRQFLSDFGLL